MGAHIRTYDPGDEQAVVDLSLRAWAPVFESMRTVLGDEIFDRLHPDWKADQAAAVRDALRDQAHDAWVASDDAPVGFVVVRLDRDRKVGQVYMVAVDPASQNAGLGTELTGFAIDFIREQGMALVEIGTGGDPGHAPARRTYEKLGLRPIAGAHYFKAL